MKIIMYIVVNYSEHQFLFLEVVDFMFKLTIEMNTIKLNMLSFEIFYDNQTLKQFYILYP